LWQHALIQNYERSMTILRDAVVSWNKETYSSKEHTRISDE
jgi:hypothetical protein